MWGFQPNGKTNDGCTRVNSSYPDRAAQGLFLREMWAHFTPKRARSLALRELQQSLGNTATYGTQHCHELLQWGGAGCSWTEDGTAGAGVLLLPSLCPFQVAASSLTRASPQSCISANLTKHFLPRNTREKNYLKPLLPHDPLHCLALRSRANSSPQGAEVTEQTVSPSHWRQWRCTRLTWPQTLASFSVALRWTRYQIPPKALIKAVFPGSSQALSKVHILRLQQRRQRSRTSICSYLFIFGKGEMAPQSVSSSKSGRELFHVVHNCRKSPTAGFLHSIVKVSCKIQSKQILKVYCIRQ